MVAQILRLKLLLIANSFHRSSWQIVGVVVSLFYGLGTALVVFAGLTAMRYFDVSIARSAAIDFGACVMVIFVVLPLGLGLEDVLDPRRFSLFGISNNRLATGISLASLISVQAIVITIIALGQVVTWSRGPLPATIALLAAVLIVLTCLLSARVATSLASFLFSTRRSRDLAGIVGIVALVSLFPAFTALASVNWARDSRKVLSTVADVIGWTPLGVAWSAPADAALGNPATGWIKLGVALIWLVALWVAWRVIVAKVLVTPEGEAKARRYGGLGWFDLLPRTPTGAIAARSLSYWTRDSRYVTSLVVIPLIPLVMVVALHIAGIGLPELAILPVPVMCLFLSWSVHNDVAFDNTAIWMHLAASTSGRADRWGRLSPALFVGAPLILLGSTLSAWINGHWEVLPSLIGVSSCVLLSGLGLSSVMSARFPYPTVRPGDSPFSQPHVGGSAAGAIQALSFVGILILCSPALGAATLGFFFGGAWHLLSLVLGLVIGGSAFAIGVRLGGKVFDRRGPELLAFALRN